MEPAGDPSLQCQSSYSTASLPCHATPCPDVPEASYHFWSPVLRRPPVAAFVSSPVPERIARDALLPMFPWGFMLCFSSVLANEGSSGPFLSVLGGSPSYPSPHTLCGYRLLECGIFIWVFFCYFWLLPPTLFYVLPRNKNFEYLYIIYTEFSALILDVTILCCWSWSWRHHNWCC